VVVEEEGEEREEVPLSVSSGTTALIERFFAAAHPAVALTMRLWSHQCPSLAMAVLFCCDLFQRKERNFHSLEQCLVWRATRRASAMACVSVSVFL